MSDEGARAARARERATRMTVHVQRPGDPAPTEELVEGLAGMALATKLSTLAFTLAGEPPKSIPRSEWPVVRRRLRDS